MFDYLILPVYCTKRLTLQKFDIKYKEVEESFLTCSEKMINNFHILIKSNRKTSNNVAIIVMLFRF